MNKLLFLYPTILFNIVRTFYFSRVCKSFGKKSSILGKIFVYCPENISIGSYTTLNAGSILNGSGGLTIGDYCRISPGVVINTAGLDLKELDYKKRYHVKDSVTIKNGVWLASGAIINPGVCIGEGAVVAAGAVVVEDVAPYTVVGGVPAKVLKMLK